MGHNEKSLSWGASMTRPEGWEFVSESGEVIDASKISLRKKSTFPRSYIECITVLYPDGDTWDEGMEDLMIRFRGLIECRNAYWKIAGEQMGLGKPWKYDCNSKQYTPAIIYRDGYIQKVEVSYRNVIFAFPTEEMRDMFYEDFREELEFCKELL